MKTATVKIDSSHWMRSHEQAFLRITSVDTENYIDVDKGKLGSYGDELTDLVFSLVDKDTTEVSYDDMKLLLSTNKGKPTRYGYAYYKKNIQPKQQTKQGTNCCDTHRVEKDHVTWIGWHCTKCGSGGSVGKTQRKKRRF